MIKSKKITLIFIILSVLICVNLIFLAQINKSNIENTQEISENIGNGYNIAKPYEVIAIIEDELQEQGTTIFEVLQNRKNSYMEELRTTSYDNRLSILAKIDTLENVIANFKQSSFVKTNDNSFRIALTNTNNEDGFNISPNCTCTNINMLNGTPCQNCVEHQNTTMAVVAIAAGFETRGWGLAADLIWFNMTNTQLDFDYWPSLGNQIIAAPQIEELAQNNSLADESDQKSPGRLSGIFESTIEGDMYNSLGSFYYTKKDAGNGNIELDIIDRYDWAYSEDGGSASIFNNTLAKAQELGIVTPFYTRINFTIPGYIPYNWEYTDDGVEITGIADNIIIAEIPQSILDLRIKPKDKVSQPKVKITSIGANAFANKTNLTEVVLLDELENGIIKEKTQVKAIGNLAFSGCSNLTTLTNFINIKYIGDSAFKNCISLNSLNKLDKLEYIGSEAFYNCKELKSVSLPAVSYLGDSAFAESLKLEEVLFGANFVLDTISERAFYNTGLSSFTIPTNVANIEDEAFLGTTITSFVSNSNYDWQDNVLIKCNVTNVDKKIAVYVNPTLSSISFPEQVAILNSKLFKDNSNIITIYLNQVENIGPEAFRNSSLTNIENANNLIDCDITALLDTPWYENQSSDYIILGKVLLNYRGTENIVKIPNNVQRIGSNAFNNKVTTQVVLSNEINSLGFSSFIELKALESIIFTSDFPPLLDGNCFGENVILYVKESRLAEYQNNICFINLPNAIEKKEILINFYDINNNFIASSKEYYGSKFNGNVNAPTIKGKDFCSWKNNSFELKINDMIEYYENLDLIAYYETAEYQIIIFGEDSEQKLVLAYGQEISLSIPKEDGKIFKGWFDQLEGGNRIIDTSGKCVWDRDIDNDILYPQYDIIIYTITYLYNNADNILDMPKEFTVDSPITKTELASPQKFGYVFKGWNYNTKKFISTVGIFNNIVLVAEWDGKTIIVKESTSITDSVAVLDFKDASNSENYIITINSSVTSITFVGKWWVDYSLSIKIADRNKAIILGFKNMKFKAPGANSANAIECNSDSTIYLTYFGENSITGGNGANGLGDGAKGGNGGYGINVNSLVLMAFDNFSRIEIYGGNGGNGSDGYAGSNGKDGTKAPSGSIFKPVKGEDGSNGTNGNCGGNGGDGAYAINARSKSIFITPNSYYTIKGGNGGNGGNGGDGGKGGDGADDTSANMFTGVGDPGDGGDGGNGGSNGQAGEGSAGTNYEKLTASGGSQGNDGEVGIGGTAGSGGNHGTVGSDGKNGAPGKGGSDGEVIVSESSSSLALAQSQSKDVEKDLPYAFSNEFIQKYLN